MKHIYIYIYIYVYAADVGICANEYIYNLPMSTYETSRVHVTMNTYETYTYIYANICS